MVNINKFKTIILYLLPILFVTILTKRTTYFLVSAGIMTLILGIIMKFIPNAIGYKNKNDKLNPSLFIILAGLCLVGASSQI
jgi:membrane-bound ClpP family serine protease